jgi:hypothetical protein
MAPSVSLDAVPDSRIRMKLGQRPVSKAGQACLSCSVRWTRVARDLRRARRTSGERRDQPREPVRFVRVKDNTRWIGAI